MKRHTVFRFPLLDPCPVCADRTHDRMYHGELVQAGGEVLTTEELWLRLVMS